jgi:hypothetical protein
LLKIDQPPLSQMKPLPPISGLYFCGMENERTFIIAAMALAAMTIAEISGALAP